MTTRLAFLASVLALVWLWSQPAPLTVARMKGTQVEQPPRVSSSGFASNPISLAGDCGWNVKVALEANNGALQNVRIAPGKTFSFNATMGDPDADPALIQRRSCAGVDGGNWCNLAARYAQVARAFGMTLRFHDHGVGDLGGGPENGVAIWNVDGTPGVGQDLEIVNTTDRTIIFRARIGQDQVVIEGGF